MASRALLCIFVVAMCLSQRVIQSNGVPITRTEILMHGKSLGREITTNEARGDDMAVEGNARMVVELQDYPGSGANNRHTPKPQFGRCPEYC